MNSALIDKTTMCPVRDRVSLQGVQTMPAEREAPKAWVTGPRTGNAAGQKILLMPAGNRLTAFFHRMARLFQAVGRFGTGKVDAGRLTRRDAHPEIYRFVTSR
jgi:hypothetical protein